MTTKSAASTSGSTSTGQSAGRPTGVMPPNSMPDSATATSCGANDALRAPRCRRTSPFTSARVVARTTHAASVVCPARRAATTTQLAETSSGMS